VEVSGTTHATANTASKYRHNKEQVPYMWIPLEGRIYVPRHGAGPNDIDVRSTTTSEPFRLVLFFN
jgi:hypothetical protein